MKKSQRCKQVPAAGFDRIERALIVALGAAIGIGDVDGGEHAGPFGEPARRQAAQFGEVAAVHRQHMVEAGDVGGHDRAGTQAGDVVAAGAAALRAGSDGFSPAWPA
jgi:hypothetical protein